jgi:hypothetical protein
MAPLSARRICVAFILATAVFTLTVASAAHAAGWETVETFAGSKSLPAEPGAWPEEVQLGGVTGMAVNVTGAGGVAPGTVYSAGFAGGVLWHVARYGPGENGGLKFELAWTSTERCGPKAEEPAHPTCKALPDGATQNVDIEVDQSTGNVYVFYGSEVDPTGVVRVYSPDGSQLISQFAAPDIAGTIDASPKDWHGGVGIAGGIAVTDTGRVYISDEDKTFNHRLMIYDPVTPGDYTKYEYAGELLAGPTSSSDSPLKPAIDDEGNIYIAGGDYVDKYSPTRQALCKIQVKTGGIEAMTVNPVTGEVFYYTYKDRKVHPLTCDGEGHFVPSPGVGPFLLEPQRGISALAFDPQRQLPQRPLGVLYAGAGTGCPATGACPEPEQSALGYTAALAISNPPTVSSESVANVTTTTATLRAQINPKGSLTRYIFQYISEAAYEENEPPDRFAGASDAPLGGASLGEGQDTLSAAVGLSGLAPDTAYRYRVVASSHCVPSEESKVCETAGADEAFRTYPAEAPGLFDNRAWEMVSPAQKHGGEVFPMNPKRSSCGSECKPGTFKGHFPQQSSPDGEAVAYEGFPFSFEEGAVGTSEYLSRRTSSGWQTVTLSPALQGNGGGQGPVAFDSGLDKSLFLQVEPSLSPEAPSDYANFYNQQTASPAALSPLLTAEPPNRSSGSSTNSLELIYAGASADLSRVFFEANDALTGETPVAPEAVDGGASKNNLYEWSAEGLRLVNVAPGNVETNPGAEFGSGFQLAIGSAQQENFSHAVSADGSRAFWSSESGQVYVREDGETTREISDHSGKFLTASADGSKLLLSDGNLFELDNGEAMVDLTEGKGGFEGIAGQSDDLSHVYFVDTKVLDGTPNGFGDVAQEGEYNLYAWDGSTRFVATLLPGDNGTGTEIRVWAASPSQRTAEASPDGRWLAFTSQGQPTGYDNTGAPGSCSAGAGHPTGPCSEAFLYDSATEELRCASCNPSGEAPRGSTTFPELSLTGTVLPQPRYLTDSGRLYFDSRDSLSVFDTNEGVEDVYQYEPQGVGTCKREGGCVSLISSGHEAIDSNLVDTDATGKNVFFTTRDQLTLKDKDELIDIYDAREGGGIASETEVARTECQGEACQPLYSAPNDPTPGSSSFEGAGNVSEPKAKKAKKHKKRQKKHAHKRAAKRNRGGAK